MKKIIFFVFLFVYLNLSYADNYWVFFTDKDIDRRGGEEMVLREAENHLSQRAIWRRNLRGNGITLFDVLPSQNYIQAVENQNYEIIGYSKWLNAVIISTDSDNLDNLNDFSFVKSIERVNSFSKEIEITKKVPINVSELNYGLSEFQLSLVGIVACHNEGYRGDGVIISIFDTGFERKHEALKRFSEADSVYIIDEWNFVNDTSSTTVGGTDETRHGTRMFGLIAGYKTGQLIGSAKNSQFCLYKTEWYDNGSPDIIAEEHWWVLAAERADSAGTDIISSSLGYRTFSDTTDYSYNDMNGNTSYTSIAAYIASQNGIVVVTAMGNIHWTNGGGEPDLDTCIKAPGDADSIISIGAVDSSGNHYLRLSSNNYWYSSACGPTSDGRRKPDISAAWWSLTVEPGSGDSAYSYGGGTSCATAITAGGVALLLQAHPSWKVKDILNALKSTASVSSNPNDTIGWGKADFYRALHSSTPEVDPVTKSSVKNIYPNPFIPGDNKNITFEYILLDRTFVSFYIYSIDGTLICFDDIGVRNDGSDVWIWNGKNNNGEYISSGLYYIRLETGYGSDLKRFVIIK